MHLFSYLATLHDLKLSSLADCAHGGERVLHADMDDVGKRHEALKALRQQWKKEALERCEQTRKEGYAKGFEDGRTAGKQEEHDPDASSVMAAEYEEQRSRLQNTVDTLVASKDELLASSTAQLNEMHAKLHELQQQHDAAQHQLGAARADMATRAGAWAAEGSVRRGARRIVG